MAPDCLKAVCQPIRIHGDPSACLFLTQNRVISMNISCRQFMASDGVISSVDPWAKSPIGVQLILPARFRVYYALQWVNSYAARLRVNLYATHLRVNSYATRLWVNLFPACSQVNPYYTLQWVNLHATHPQVIPYCALNLNATHLWVNVYAAHQWKN